MLVTDLLQPPARRPGREPRLPTPHFPSNRRHDDEAQPDDASSGAACAALAVPARHSAQALPKTQLRSSARSPACRSTRTSRSRSGPRRCREKSGGAITAEVKGFNEMGLKGPEVLRLMGQGVMEIGATVDRLPRRRRSGQRDDRHGRPAARRRDGAPRHRRAAAVLREALPREVRRRAARLRHLPGAGALLQRRAEGPGRRQGQEGARRRPVAVGAGRRRSAARR